MVSAKRLGFLTGAAVASVAVYAFYALTTVTDEDLLTSVVLDHCTPYVKAGETPFAGMGRTVGVYDNANLDETVSNGGNAILFENRFVGQWGETVLNGISVRNCQVTFLGERSSSSGFIVSPSNLFQWAETNLTSTLGLERSQAGFGDFGTGAYLWFTPDASPLVGLQVQLIFQETSVLRVIVVADAD